MNIDERRKGRRRKRGSELYKPFVCYLYQYPKSIFCFVEMVFDSVTNFSKFDATYHLMMYPSFDILDVCVRRQVRS